MINTKNYLLSKLDKIEGFQGAIRSFTLFNNIVLQGDLLSVICSVPETVKDLACMVDSACITAELIARNNPSFNMLIDGMTGRVNTRNNALFLYIIQDESIDYDFSMKIKTIDGNPITLLSYDGNELTIYGS